MAATNATDIPPTGGGGVTMEAMADMLNELMENQKQLNSDIYEYKRNIDTRMGELERHVAKQTAGSDPMVTMRRGSRGRSQYFESPWDHDMDEGEARQQGSVKRQTLGPKEISALGVVWGGDSMLQLPRAREILNQLKEPRAAKFKDNKEARKQFKLPEKFDPKGDRSILEYIDYFDARMAKLAIDPEDRDFEGYMPGAIEAAMQDWMRAAEKRGVEVTYEAARLWLASSYTPRDSEESRLIDFSSSKWDGQGTIADYVDNHEQKAQRAGVINWTEVQFKTQFQTALDDDKLRKVFISEYEHTKTKYLSEGVDFGEIEDKMRRFYLIAKETAQKMDDMGLNKNAGAKTNMRGHNTEIRCYGCGELGHIRNKCPKHKKEVCRFFQQTGTCKYGDKCKYAHVSDSNWKSRDERTQHDGNLRNWGHTVDKDGIGQGNESREKGAGISDQMMLDYLKANPKQLARLESLISSSCKVEGTTTPTSQANEIAREPSQRAVSVVVDPRPLSSTTEEIAARGLMATPELEGGGSVYLPVKLSHPGTVGRTGRMACKGLLDPGCTHTGMAEWVADKLGLRLEPVEARCSGLGTETNMEVVGVAKSVSMKIDDKVVLWDKPMLVFKNMAEPVVIGLDLVRDGLVVPDYPNVECVVGRDKKRRVKMMWEMPGSVDLNYNGPEAMLMTNAEWCMPLVTKRGTVVAPGKLLEVTAVGTQNLPIGLEIVDSVCNSDEPRVHVRNVGFDPIIVRANELELKGTVKEMGTMSWPNTDKSNPEGNILQLESAGVEPVKIPDGFPDDLWTMLSEAEQKDAAENLGPFPSVELKRFAETVDVNSKLATQQRQRLKAILLAHADRAAAPGERDPPFVAGVVETIHMPNPQPKNMGYQKFSPIEKIYLRAQQERLGRQGRISRSKSSWAARVVLVPKKLPKEIEWERFQGTWWEDQMLVEEVASWFRFCTDLRLANAQMTPMAYPLRDMVEIMEILSQSKYYADMDVADAFFTVQLEEASRKCTAFRLPTGLWEWNVLPQGSKISASAWAKVVDRTFDQVPEEDLVYFQDDLRPHGGTFEEFIRALITTFRCMRKVDMLYKMSKSRFGYTNTEFLGHVISHNSRRPNPKKVEAIAQIALPKTQTDIRSFINMAGFYRKFIKDFSKIAAPLHELTQSKYGKDISVQAQAEPVQTAIKQLKDALCSGPVLAAPRMHAPFQVATDWCRNGRGIGAVLQQLDANEKEVHPIAYWSKKCSPTERRFSSNEGELWAVFEGVRHFRQYLQNGCTHTVLTDHKALKAALTQVDPHHKLWRWLRYLQRFDIKFEHRDGTKHAHADGLSRLPVVEDVPDWEDEEFQENLVTFAQSAVHCRRVFTRGQIRSALADQDKQSEMDDEDADNVDTASDVEVDNDEDVINLEEGYPLTSSWKDDATTDDIVEEHRHLEGEKFTDEETDRLYEVSLVDWDEECGKVVAFRRPLDDKPMEDGDMDPFYIPYVLQRVEVYKETEEKRQLTKVVDVSMQRVIDAQKKDKWALAAHANLLQNDGAWKDGFVEGQVGALLVRIDKNEIMKVKLASNPRSPGEEQESPRWRVYLPKVMQEDVVSLYHEQCGHAGVVRLRLTMSTRYWWKGMEKVIRKVVRGCRKCQLRKKLPRPPVPVGKMETAYRPNQRVHIDHITGLPETERGNKNMITAECALTKWIEARPMKEITADATAQFVVEEIITRHGVPETIVTDQGPAFEARMFKHMAKLLRVRKMRTTPYHPQSDGIVERAHRTMHDAMSHLVNRVQSDWDRVYYYMLMALRATVCTATGYSPFYLQTGREMRIPADSEIDEAVVEALDQHGGKIDRRAMKIAEEVKKAWRRAVESISKQEQKYNTPHKPRRWQFKEFEVNEWVFVMKPYKNPKVKNKRGKIVERKATRKFAYRWEGPYRITKKMSPVVYVVKQGKNERTWHAMNMKAE